MSSVRLPQVSRRALREVDCTTPANVKAAALAHANQPVAIVDGVDGQARPSPRRLWTLGTLGSSPAPALGFSPRRGRTVAGHRSLSHRAMSGTGKAEMTQQTTA